MIAYAIKSGRVLLPFSIRLTRKDAIKYFEKDYGTTWEYLKKHGHSVVKVEIWEV